METQRETERERVEGMCRVLSFRIGARDLDALIAELERTNAAGIAAADAHDEAVERLLKLEPPKPRALP